MSKKLKFKIWEKVVYKQTRLWVVYKIYSYTTLNKKIVTYTINTDDEYDGWIYPYQLRKYKPIIIWLNTNEKWQ